MAFFFGNDNSAQIELTDNNVDDDYFSKTDGIQFGRAYRENDSDDSDDEVSFKNYDIEACVGKPSLKISNEGREINSNPNDETNQNTQHIHSKTIGSDSLHLVADLIADHNKKGYYDYFYIGWNLVCEKLSMLIALGMLYGIGFALRWFGYKGELYGGFLYQWIDLVVLYGVFMYAGRILDYVIFFVLRLFMCSKNSTLIFYYASSFEGFSGMIIMNALFNFYYMNVIDIKHRNISRLVLFIIFILVGKIVHDVCIKIYMREKLLGQFEEKIDEILVYKWFIEKISNSETKHKNPRTYSDVFWKLNKAKDKGFEVHIGGQRIQILKRKKMLELSNVVWNNLLQKFPNERGVIPTEQILQYCGINENDKYYMKFHDIIDPNKDYITTHDEFNDALIKIFDSWKQLSSALLGLNNINKALSMFSTFLYWFVECFIFMAIFEISSNSILVPLLTFSIIASFALGNVTSQFITSLIFITFIHPYDVGDKISSKDILDRNSLIIKEINIWVTIVSEVCSGKLIHIPNHVMMNSCIENHTQSKNVVITIPMWIGSLTTQQQLDFLLHEVKEHIKDEISSWKPNVSLYANIADPASGKMQITFWVEHKCEWIQSNDIFISKTKLMMKIMDIMKKLHIEYQEFDTFVRIKQD